jgi:hypothetical protein
MQPLAPFVLFKLSDLLARHGRCDDHSATAVPSFVKFVESFAAWAIQGFRKARCAQYFDIDKADIRAA